MQQNRFELTKQYHIDGNEIDIIITEDSKFKGVILRLEKVHVVGLNDTDDTCELRFGYSSLFVPENLKESNIPEEFEIYVSSIFLDVIELVSKQLEAEKEIPTS
jgi:hypothetical protein